MKKIIEINIGNSITQPNEILEQMNPTLFSGVVYPFNFLMHIKDITQPGIAAIEKNKETMPVIFDQEDKFAADDNSAFPIEFNTLYSAVDFLYILA